jgi:hypothetical protein
MPCSPLKVNQHFGGTYCFHLQCQRISWTRNQGESRWKQSSLTTYFRAGFLLRLFFCHWRWRRYVSPKHWLTFNGLHGIISQKIVLSLTTTVRTSNPTNSQLVSSACFPVFHNHIISHLMSYKFALHTLLLNETRTKQIFEVSCTHVTAGC